jgi:hypothetical protein
MRGTISLAPVTSEGSGYCGPFYRVLYLFLIIDYVAISI